ncbi:MAG: hypothetical protein HYU66_28100, partial [Armatimonadetes bacterium]|nr:hypothetical protein [Armatimonadota bacterium]
MSDPHPDGNHRLRLRPLEAIPFEHDGERRIAWRDPMGISPTVEVAQPVAVLMSLFDGSRTGDEVRAAWLEL